MANENTDITGQIGGCTFPQWYFERGNVEWTSEEVAAVEAPIRRHMQNYYDQFDSYATNYWRVWKVGYGDDVTFTAVKRTWEYGAIGGRSAEEVAQGIEDYYSKNK